jgi:class 3 adenylate cyclase/tetratricopeptide (TPR) repeat protein
MGVVIGLTGRPRLEVDGVPVPDEGLGHLGRVALAFLVSERERPVRHDELAEVLWGDEPPATWESALRVHVTKLRAVLRAAGLTAKEVLVSRGGCYHVRLPADLVIDLDVAEEMLVDARSHLTTGNADAARRAAAAVAAVAGRQFLPGARGIWVEERQRDVRELRLKSLEVFARAACECGEWDIAVQAGEEAIAAEPFRETAYQCVMNAHRRAGNPGLALAVYERCRRALADDLGVSPTPTTEAEYMASLGSEDESRLPGGLVTFLLTDIEGSTAMWDASPQDMAIALARHDALIASVVGDHHGQTIKSQGEGDATLSVFAHASDAAAAAMAIQRTFNRETWPGELALRVRAALHTGEAQLRDGDYFGPTLNRAARLRGLAEGGTIVLSQATAALIADTPRGGTVVARGRVELKGLARPEMVFDLVEEATVSPQTTEQGPTIVYPRVLRAEGSRPFVNRSAERQFLADACEQAPSEHQIALVAGEPGAGKTRLVAEVARELHARGIPVVAGRCSEGLGLPYEPFVEALHDAAEQLSGSQFETIVGPFCGQLVRLIPSLATRMRGVTAAANADPEADRYALFEAIGGCLASLGEGQRLLLVLDDLQWATTPTLLLLRHLLRSQHATSLAIVGIYRDTDLNRQHPLAGLVGDLSRERAFSRLELGGLDSAAVGALLQEDREQPLDVDGEALANKIHRETEGNPFFVGELIRHLEETDRLRRPDGTWASDDDTGSVSIPIGVREVVDRRVGRLSEPAARLLPLASVIGLQFDLDLLGLVSDNTEDEALDALEEAQAAKLVTELGVGSYAFAHGIVRATLLDGLSRTRRVRLHRKVASAIEGLHTDDRDEHLAALAHHWLEAGDAGDSERAIDAVFAAAQQAEERGASDDAANLLARLLPVAQRTATDADVLREIALRYAVAAQRAGREDAWTALGDAARAAEAAGDADRLVRAVIARRLGAPADTRGADAEQVALHHAALTALGPDASGERMLVLASLGNEYSLSAPEQARVFFDEAMGLATELDDPAMLVWAAQFGHPAHLTDRDWENRALAALDAVDALTSDPLNRWERCEAHVLRHAIAMNRGDIVEARVQFTLLKELVGKGASAANQWNVLVLESCHAFLEGRLAEATDWNREQLEYGSETGRRDAPNYFVVLDGSVCRDQGRGPEFLIESMQRAIPTLHTTVASFARAYLATWLVDAGRDDEAREIVRHERATGFRIARAPFSLGTTYADGMSDAVTSLGDRESAAELFDIMAPWSGRFFYNYVQFYGPVDRSLGRLASLLGRFDEADRYLEAAAELLERAGAPLFLARTWADQAELELVRSNAEGVASARSLVDRSVAVARGLDAPGVERYAMSVLDRHKV